MKLNITSKNATLIFLLVVIILFPCIAEAQPSFTDDVSDVPIDGGLSLLVAAGVGYGAKKIQQRRAIKKSDIR